MCVQTRTSSPKHLSFWNSLSLNSQLGGGLEASYYGEADFVGSSEVVERRTKYRESRPTRAIEFVQEQQRGIHQEGEKLCNEQQKKTLICMFEDAYNNMIVSY